MLIIMLISNQRDTIYRIAISQRIISRVESRLYSCYDVIKVISYAKGLP